MGVERLLPHYGVFRASVLVGEAEAASRQADFEASPDGPIPRKSEGQKMKIGTPQRVIEVVPLVEPVPPAPEPMPDEHPSVAEPRPEKEPVAP